MAQEGRGRRADAAVAPRLSPALPEDQSFSSSGRIVARFAIPDGDGGYDEWLNTLRPTANGESGTNGTSANGGNGRARLYSLPGDSAGSRYPTTFSGRATFSGGPPSDRSDEYTGRRRKLTDHGGAPDGWDSPGEDDSGEYTGRRRKFGDDGSFDRLGHGDDKEYTGRRRALDPNSVSRSRPLGPQWPKDDGSRSRPLGPRWPDADESGEPGGTVYQSRTSHHGNYPAVGRSRYVAAPDPRANAPVARGVFRIPVSGIPDSGVPDSGIPDPGIPNSGIPVSGVEAPPAVGVVQTGSQPAQPPPAKGVVHTGSQPALQPGYPPEASGQQQALSSPPAPSGPPGTQPFTGGQPALLPPGSPQAPQPLPGQPVEEQIPGREGRVLVVQRFGQPSSGQGGEVEAERPAVYRSGRPGRGGSPVGFGGPPSRDRSGSIDRPDNPVPSWRPAGRYAGVHRGQPSGRPLPFWQELPLLMLVAFSLAVLVNTFLLQAFTIPSGSMENTLRVNDKVVTEKVSLDFREPKRGEIVVFKASGGFKEEVDLPDRGPVASFFSELARALGFPTADEKDIIKRVVGLPGDRVECCDEDGRVLVNGEPLDEPYILDNDPINERDFGPVTVPPGRLFVMGDHRAISNDSRKVLANDPKFKGTVPIDAIIGRAVFIVYPAGHWTGLGDPELFTGVPQPAALPDTERAPPVSTTVAIGLPFLPMILLPGLRRRGRHRLRRMLRRAST